MWSESNAMTVAEAEALLDEAEEIVPCLQMGLADAKSLREQLLEQGIPSAFGRDDHCTSGCSPKVLLLARREDIPRIARHVHEDLLDSVAKIGNAGPDAMKTFSKTLGAGVTEPEGDPPCPACGHEGPLDNDGACAECGLVLG